MWGTKGEKKEEAAGLDEGSREEVRRAEKQGQGRSEEGSEEERRGRKGRKSGRASPG